MYCWMKLKGKHFSSSYPVGRVGPAECEVSKPTRTKTLLMLGEIVVGWEGAKMVEGSLCWFRSGFYRRHCFGELVYGVLLFLKLQTNKLNVNCLFIFVCGTLNLTYWHSCVWRRGWDFYFIIGLTVQLNWVCRNYVVRVFWEFLQEFLGSFSRSTSEIIPEVT